MKIKIILPVLALAMAGGLVWISIPKVSAETVRENTVFDQQRSDRQAQVQAGYEERLTQAVKEGKITEAQKTAILKKHQEMQTKREQEREEWQAWLKANDLENSEFGFGPGFGGRGMKGMGRGMHGW